MTSLREKAPTVPRPRTPLHLHRFSLQGTDAFSSASLYTCRCGVVRAAW